MSQIAEIRVKAEPRRITGKRVRHLRSEGLTPANLSGKSEPIAIQAPTKSLRSALHLAGQTQLIQLDVNGRTHPVLVREIQRDPVTQELLHVEFAEVNLRERTRATVPVELKSDSPAVKEGGVLARGITSVEVEALPAEIPALLEADLSKITEVGQALYVRDLEAPPGVTVLTDPDELIASVSASRGMLAEEAAAEGEALPPTPGGEGEAEATPGE